MAFRGPFCSTHFPPKAAESPSMTMEMLKTIPIAVSELSNLSTSGFLNTLNA